MSMQDPIADMLTRIRNAQTTGDTQCAMPASKLKSAILTVLKNEGYIQDFELTEDKGKKNLTVFLKYFQGKPVIEKIKRISSPGLRIYKKSTELSSIRAEMGIVVVSTPKGVMTAEQAQAQNLGAEVLCTVI